MSKLIKATKVNIEVDLLNKDKKVANEVASLLELFVQAGKNDIDNLPRTETVWINREHVMAVKEATPFGGIPKEKCLQVFFTPDKSWTIIDEEEVKLALTTY